MAVSYRGHTLYRGQAVSGYLPVQRPYRWGKFQGWSTMQTTEPEPKSAPTIPIPLLQDAIASKCVTAEFRGNGGSSGDSVLAALAKGPKASSEALETSLPAGSVLVSDDASAQNMVIVGVKGILRGGNQLKSQTRIEFTDGDAVVYVLAAYCMEFEKENPSPDTRFTLKRPDPVLACIAQEGRSLTIPAMQAAVWMKTESLTYDHMNQKFPITPKDWAAGRKAFQECRVTGVAKPAAVQ
jgi:hypothetical protein